MGEGRRNAHEHHQKGLDEPRYVFSGNERILIFVEEFKDVFQFVALSSSAQDGKSTRELDGVDLASFRRWSIKRSKEFFCKGGKFLLRRLGYGPR